MIKIDKNMALMLYKKMNKYTGGAFGIRDEGLLDSALESIYQEFGGVELYKGVEMKSARLCFNIIKNHPFIDGNKRLGVYIMLVYAYLNGLYIKLSDDEIIDLGMNVASGKYDFNDILNIINNSV